jgi:pyruvate/2-oxoglutarate/acetoin dehydrogenase E1 component
LLGLKSFLPKHLGHSCQFHPDNHDFDLCSVAMEPLSVIASVLTVGAFVTASLKVILQVRGASDEVQALINEISDLSAIIKDAEHTLRCNKRLKAAATGLTSLHAVLSKANTIINHLHAFVSRVLMKEESLLRNARISRTAWLKEKPQVSKYQRQLFEIKLELSHALGIANL